MWDNPDGSLEEAPENYVFFYPEIAELAAYQVFLYYQPGEPMAEVYAYNSDIGGGQHPTLEAMCDQFYDKVYATVGNRRVEVQRCYDTGEGCHWAVHGTSVVIVRCVD